MEAPEQKTRTRSDPQEAFNAGPLFACELTLPFHYVKKNSKSIFYRKSKAGRTVPFIASSARQRDAEKILLLALQSRAVTVRPSEPIRDPVWAMLSFFYPRAQFLTKKNTINRNLPDLSNLIEGPQDALTKAGIIEDDCIVMGI